MKRLELSLRCRSPTQPNHTRQHKHTVTPTEPCLHGLHVTAYTQTEPHSASHIDGLARTHAGWRTRRRTSWGRRGEHEPTLPAYRRATSPSPPSAPLCFMLLLQHLRGGDVGHGGERGRATRPCDRLRAGRAACDRSGTRPCPRRYRDSRPGSSCSSAPRARR